MTARTPPTSAPAVLDVDGRGHDGLVTAMALESAGYDATRVSTAEDALRVVGVVRPAALVIEPALPDADGWELGERLRERLGTEPLIVATSVRGDPEAFARSTAAGFASHFAEPVNLQALRQFLDKARVLAPFLCPRLRCDRRPWGASPCQRRDRSRNCTGWSTEAAPPLPPA